MGPEAGLPEHVRKAAGDHEPISSVPLPEDQPKDPDVAALEGEDPAAEEADEE